MGWPVGARGGRDAVMQAPPPAGRLVPLPPGETGELAALARCGTDRARDDDAAVSVLIRLYTTALAGLARAGCVEYISI